MDKWGVITKEEVDQMIAHAVAAEKERCAIVALDHYMDACKVRRTNPAKWGEWCAAESIRKS